MRVLLTGASSFTGFWFARALARRGATIVAACRGRPAAYDPLRRQRIDQLEGAVRPVFDCAFGSDAFLDLLDRAGPFDVVGLHGAEVGDFRRNDYDALDAAAATTRNAGAVLDRLAAMGSPRIVVTGSVFEADEGDGDRPLRAIGAYGLAKTLAWHLLRFEAQRRGLTPAKFVIANPVGAMARPGLVSAFMAAWLGGETPAVRHPHLVRDNIPVEALADAYAEFALAPRGDASRLAPSGRVETVARFVERLSLAMTPRLKRPCRFVLADPPAPSNEPIRRFNMDRLSGDHAGDDGWEGPVWDSLAAWHLDTAPASPGPRHRSGNLSIIS